MQSKTVTSYATDTASVTLKDLRPQNSISSRQQSLVSRQGSMATPSGAYTMTSTLNSEAATGRLHTPRRVSTPLDPAASQSVTPSYPASSTHYQRSATPTQQSYQRSATPTQQSYQRSATPTQQIYRRSVTPTQQIYQRSVTPTQQIYQRSVTPTQQIYQRSVTPTQQAYQSTSMSYMGPETRKTSQVSYQGATTTTTTTVTGEPHVTGQRTHVGQSHVLSEHVVEHNVVRPKKQIIEETVERIVVVPEVQRKEVVTEETRKIRERTYEVAKPTKREVIVETPNILYVDKVIEVPDYVEKTVYKQGPPREPETIYIPKLVPVEKIVEVEEVEYRKKSYEQIVEVVEYVEEAVIKEIAKPRYVDVPVPQYVEREVIEDVTRQVPVPVESVTTVEFKLPKIKEKREKIRYPVFAPRFVEVAVPAELLDEATKRTAEELLQEVATVVSHPNPSLCEVEATAASAKDFNPHINRDPESVMRAYQAAASHALHTGQAPVVGPSPPPGMA